MAGGSLFPEILRCLGEWGRAALMCDTILIFGTYNIQIVEADFQSFHRREFSPLSISRRASLKSDR